MSEPGASCDETCNKFGFVNAATRARKVVPENDCTIIKHFIGPGKLTEKWISSAGCWTFGSTYVPSFSSYSCAAYKSVTSNCGVEEGTNTNNANLQVVCPCSYGNDSIDF